MHISLISLSGSGQGTAWGRTRMFAVLKNLLAVHKNVLNAGSVLMRLHEGGPVRDCGWVEHNEVGEHAFFYKAATIEPEICRR